MVHGFWLVVLEMNVGLFTSFINESILKFGFIGNVQSGTGIVNTVLCLCFVLKVVYFYDYHAHDVLKPYVITNWCVGYL